MLTKTITIQMAEGFHMRPASQMVKILKPFQSEITMVYGEKRINAKQLMKIMGACIKKGAEITFECQGEDEAAAMAKIEELEQNNFGE